MEMQEIKNICEWKLATQYSPDIITELEDNDIFVFGSKPDGRHIGGASRIAVTKFGAREGLGEGFSGQSYAIPVHRHRKYLMREAIQRFILFAKDNPQFSFFVLPVGCGNAGMNPKDVAFMFFDALFLNNVFLPKLFLEEILNTYSTQNETKRGNIAIARDYGMVLNDDGSVLFLNTQKIPQWRFSSQRYVKIAAAFEGFMGLTEDGRIITGGPAREFDRCNTIESLSNIKDVVACEGHTVAIDRTGNVICIDEPGGWEGIPNHAKVVNTWHNIKQVAVGFDNIMGLTEDGRVLYHSVDGFTNTHYYDEFNDVIQIDCYSHYYGDCYSAVLHKNGTVSSESFEGVDKWQNIVQISVGADIIIGLKSDGTIEMIDYRNLRSEVKDWTNIESIECKFFGVIAKTRTGEIKSLFT